MIDQATPRPETILALDPATRTGWAWRLYGDTTTPPRCGAWDYHDTGPAGSRNPSGYRLAAFHDDLTTKVQDQGVTLVAYEDAHYGSVNHLTAAFHAEMRGIVHLVCAQLGIKCMGFAPTTIKKFWTGHGGADKVQMMRACQTWHGLIVSDPDAADALAILALAEDELRTGGVARRAEAAAKARRTKKRPTSAGQLALFKIRRK